MPGKFPATTTDRWQTAQIVLDGGILDNTDQLSLAHAKPGALIDGVNFECGLRGGYRRINGFTQFDTVPVPGTAAVLGVSVFPNMGVVAARNNHLYYSSGSGGWSTLDTINMSSFTGAVLGNNLTVSGSITGTVTLGTILAGSGVTGSPIIVSQTSGSTGGAGVYVISGPTLTLSARAMTAAFAVRTAPAKVRFSNFNYGIEKIIIVDGVNVPATWDGTTFSTLYNFPVTGAKYALNFGNYMFVAVGSDLYFSAPADETLWDGTLGAGVVNMGFIITGLRSWRGTLYVFGESRISAITGTVFGGATPDAVLTSVTTNVGCIAADSIVEISGDVLYLAADGIRTISGTTRIGDVELAAITDPIHDPFIAFVQQYAFSNFCAVSVRAKNQYRLFASNSGTNQAASNGWNVCIRGSSYSYTGVTNNWEFFKLQGIDCYCADSGYINEIEYVVHGAFNGRVYRQEQGNNFAGVPISALLQLPYNGFDDPELRKTFYKIKSNILSEGLSNLTIQLNFDWGNTTTNQPMPFPISTLNDTVSYYGSAIYGTSYYAASGNPEYFNYAIGSGLNMSIIYSSNDLDSSPYTIRSLVLDYQINGRR